MHGQCSLLNVCLTIPTPVYRRQTGCLPVALLCSDDVLLVGLLDLPSWLLPDVECVALNELLTGLARLPKELMLWPLSPSD